MPWYRVAVQFTDRLPTEKVLTNMRALCADLDYDMPRLEVSGMLGDWRQPAVQLGVLLNALHILGYPCKGRWLLEEWEKYDRDIDEVLAEVDWVQSQKDLTSASSINDFFLRRFSRRFAPYLPTRPKGRKKRRRRSTR